MSYQLDITEIPLDAEEPNNSIGTAVDVGSSTPTFTGLSLHTPTDQDFFRYVAPSDVTLRVNATFSDADGNVDIALQDSLGGTIIQSTGGGDTETITASLDAGDEAFIRVFSVTSETNTDYDLQLSVSSPPSIGGITTQFVDQNSLVKTEVPLTVSDPDTPLSQLLIGATSSNSSFIS